jgi:hypothetical protein
VYMAEENQIHLVTAEPKHVTIGSILSFFSGIMWHSLF